MNTLDLTADLGDLLVKFDKWLKKTDPFTQGFTKVGEGIKFIIEQFQKLKEYLDTIPEFQAFTAELDSFKESLKGLSFEDVLKRFEKFVAYLENKLPKGMKNVGKNVISGFKNGLSSGKTEIPKILSNIGIRLLKAIKKVLGIHSPSKEMEKVGEYTLSGLWNGLTSGKDKIVDFFKNLGSDMLDKLQGVNWSSVIASGIGVGVVLGLKRLSDIVDKALSPAEGVGKVLSGAGEVLEESTKKVPKILNNVAKVVKSFSKVLKAKAFKTRAEGVKDLAIAIAILAGSLFILSTINTDALHNAEEAMLILVGVLAVMTYVMDKLSSASASIGKGGVKIDGLKSGLAGLGIAILLMAESVKILGKLDKDEINQGMASAGLLLTGIMGIVGLYGALVKGEAAKNIDKMGKTVSKIGKTMLLIVGVIKLFSMLSPDEVNKGLEFAGVFTGFVIVLAAISYLAGDNIDSLGKTIKSIVVSMGLMIGVVKLAGQLDPGEMIKGGIFAAAFLAFIVGLELIGKFLGGNSIDELGKMLLSVSLSMLIMVGIVKLAGQLSSDDMINGVKFAGAFLAFLSALIKITSKGGETVKLAGTLLAVSVAIGLLAGISVLLGLVDTEQLAKGVIAVAVLGIIMTRMIKATQGANDVKGNVIAMAVAIGVMAAAVAALSLIDSIKLAIATACLGALMGMFALMELAGSKASGSIISLIAITAVIVVLAGVLYLLRDLPVKNSLAVAASLSILLLAMSVTLGLLSIVGAAALPGLVSLAVVTAVVAALAFILYQLKDLDPDQALGMVKALSIFLLALSGCCVVLAVVGTVAVPALIGVAVLSALILALIGLTALAAHISKTLPDLGKNLGDFMKNAKPFIEGAKNIDESVGKGVSSLCGAILKLTGTEIISAVTAFLSGDASFSKFGSQLQAFGKAIVAYANTVKGINAEDILASAKAAKALVALNDALPKSGGLRRLAIYTGDVYVREPSGSGYWASISVSISQTHCEVSIPVSLDITRVEGGI